MESIVYFYPETMLWPKNKDGTGKQSVAKKHWWQFATLHEREIVVPNDKIGALIACGVPSFYYKRKEWNATYLSEEMKRVTAGTEGMTDTMLHPEVERMLDRNMRHYFLPRTDTLRRLAALLMEEYAADIVRRSGRVVVLLETIMEMDWQMKMTWHLLLPYLSFVNELTFYMEGSDKAMETDSTASGDCAEEIFAEYLEDYYYEYGLVAQMKKYHNTVVGMKAKKTKGSCIVIDFAKKMKMPIYPINEKMIYIDVVSGMDKENLIVRKNANIRYYSPRKYLDTILKNSYDKLVK